jgi:hypothetical protein
MPEYVWTTEIWMHTDVPEVTRYELVRKLKNGVVVRHLGSERTIRDAGERRFFYSREDMQKFCRRHMERMLEIHKSQVQTLQAALALGITARHARPDSPTPMRKLTAEDL